jgi:hypothetical protein
MEALGQLWAESTQERGLRHTEAAHKHRAKQAGQHTHTRRERESRAVGSPLARRKQRSR